MRLSPEDLSAVWVALRNAPFNAGMSTADEVETVLKTGNEKHGADIDSVLTHLQHAMRHFKAYGADTETGCSHRAHGIARLLLAVMAACRGGDSC